MQNEPLALKMLHQIDAWWQAANHLSVGQIHLFDNPLSRKPLELAHIKPRLLGYSTSPSAPCR